MLVYDLNPVLTHGALQMLTTYLLIVRIQYTPSNLLKASDHWDLDQSLIHFTQNALVTKSL